MKKDLDVSLVIPAYNEEDSIKKIVTPVDQVLKKTALRYEIIIVNDGSQDATWKKALDLSITNTNVKVINYNVNQGKGYALVKGFSHARGDIVVFLDSDLDITPEQIRSFIRALKYGDLVISSKHHPQSIVEVPFLRRFLSFGFNLFVKLLTGLRVSDTQTGLKAVRRKTLEPVFSVLTVRRFAFDVEFLTVANLYGLIIVEMPVRIRITNNLFSPFQIWRMFVDLLGISYRLKVLNWYQHVMIR